MQRRLEKKKEAEIISRRAELIKSENRELDNQHSDMEERLMEHSRKAEEKMLEKVRRMKSESEKALGKLMKYKEDKELSEKRKLESLQEKIVRRQAAFKTWMDGMSAAEEEKRKIKAEKEKRFYNAKDAIEKMDNAKIRGMEEKFKKAEDYVKAKRAEEERRMRLRQEFRRLKEQDKLENYERERRREEYEIAKMREKNERVQEKLQLMRAQQELLQKTRLEAALHAKIERERILNGISAFTSTVFSPRMSKIEDPKSPNDIARMGRSLKLLDKIIPETNMGEKMREVKRSLEMRAKGLPEGEQMASSTVISPIAQKK
eukprot:TRINITY_DN1111_c0_g4_i1.p1 TRINITY_DN1111_c0_g4~~TRINITY_DN1111_c0_g4_i1.p1  ORF type:complete len:318 (+),score=107.92 TRINITY_DN1111_c0_g4_i1:630-1583(+)